MAKANIALPPGKIFPHEAYYSTQPFLAWCLNHYVYDKTHYVWASRYFFPYRALNPKSSNPYQIFQDFYQPCVDRDQHDAFIQQKRLKLRAGINAVIGDPTHLYYPKLNDLFHICDHIDVTFFWPIIYLIDESVATSTSRGTVAGSGLVGSEERLIKDLKEDEFTLVIPDFDRESPLNGDIDDLVNDRKSNDDAIKLLLIRS